MRRLKLGSSIGERSDEHRSLVGNLKELGHWEDLIRGEIIILNSTIFVKNLLNVKCVF
jgi:hypothetical protein